MDVFAGDINEPVGGVIFRIEGISIDLCRWAVKSEGFKQALKGYAVSRHRSNYIVMIFKR
jgi:hypothetical protein